MACVTRKASDQPAHTRSLIIAFACHLNSLRVLSTDCTSFEVSKLKKRLHSLFRVYTCQNATLLEITCRSSFVYLQTLGTAACPPYHLAFVVGGTSAEFNLKTVKLASTKYLDTLPTSGERTIYIHSYELEGCPDC